MTRSFAVAIAALMMCAGAVRAQIPEPPVASGMHGTSLDQQTPAGITGNAGIRNATQYVPDTRTLDNPPLPPVTPGNRSATSAALSRSAEIPLPPTATASGPSRGGGGWVSGQAALSGGPFPGYMTGYGTGQVMAGFGGGAPSAVQKPFSAYAREPSVSPYINLYRPEGAFGTVGNYYSLVRPMVQQQQINRQVSRQINQMQSVMSPATGYGGRSGGTGGYFMNYYGFYPGLGSR